MQDLADSSSDRNGSGANGAAAARDHGALAVTGWAVFLASSWTWCIGMFLPVLLVRDFGVWGWVVFAIPNVVGAAAMGWVLRDAPASQRLVDAHRPACAAFSWVTIAFHLFFGSWMVRQLVPDIAGAVGLALTIAVCWAGTVRAWTSRLMSLLIYAASVVLLVIVGARGGLRMPEPGVSAVPLDLLALAAVCVFGFALCPYLDLTFHRARQSTTPAGGRVAFGAGFGVLFFAMIVFTLLYADELIERPAARTTILSLIGLHMILQSGFTIAAHLHQLGTRGIRTGGMSLAGVSLCAAAIGLGFAPFTYHGREGGELVYRCFMAFYGLVFPAYIWLCAWPLTGGSMARPTKRALLVFALAVVAATPGFWVAFVEGRMVWVLPALGVVLGARLFADPPTARARTAQ